MQFAAIWFQGFALSLERVGIERKRTGEKPY
jgi:hypothetical protein